jgi:hypothetical protein
VIFAKTLPLYTLVPTMGALLIRAVHLQNQLIKRMYPQPYRGPLAGNKDSH